MTGLCSLLLFFAPEFVNVAEKVGLPDEPSGRMVFVDVNGDGRLDIVQNRTLILHQRDGRFEPGPALPFVPSIALFADYDNDGDADCFAGMHCEPEQKGWKDHGKSSALFLNDGKGNWTTLPLKLPRTSLHGACTLDYDQDGKLDLFLGTGYRQYGKSLECYVDRLYRGDGKGGFADVSEKVGLVTAREPGGWDSSMPTYGVTHGDFNGDGWQDLWVATYGRQRNALWINHAGKRFTNLAPRIGFDGDADVWSRYPDWTKNLWKEKYGAERVDELPFRSNGNTFDCAIADYDNDGDMDCILAEITHAWAGPSSDRTSLLINDGSRFRRDDDAFERHHKVQRWNQGDIHCGWLDYDNDGLLDALVASSDYPDRQELKLYRQRRNHTFEKARLFDWEGAGQISVGDYDNDGDLDILCGRSLNRLPADRRKALGKRPALFRNDVGNKNHWLQVVVKSESINRDGIGCRIRLLMPDESVQTRVIRGGRGHAGHNDPYVAHFGLGAHTQVIRVGITWFDGKGSTKQLDGVQADQRLVVRQ
ncbi:MAG: CRTAC1 family protein [Planctomycetota bacterium]|jgi:hypothetical protein